ncbi:Uncharacterised protein [Bordetella pertussis]|nr:Uncharacterised protein [Bordetella pertussis]
MITEILGTVTSEIAFIQFMIRPGAARRSPSMPIRKPGWSTRNTSCELSIGCIRPG